jgi:hypothetical protein
MDPDVGPKRKSRPRRSSGGEEFRNSNPPLPLSSSVSQAAVINDPSDDDRALYWQLLKHHHENDMDGFDGADTQSILSEEDKKLPAISSRTLKALQHQYGGIKRESLSSPFKQRNSDPMEAISLESKSSSTLTSKISVNNFDKTGLLRERQAEKWHVREQGHSPNHFLPLSSEKIPSRSSFYKAALEAAGRTSPPLTHLQTFIEEDEKLARELSKSMAQEISPQVSALDEELARALQNSQGFTPPPNDEREDAALALKLMQEEQEIAISGLPLTREEKDVELALRLMEEEHQKQYRKPTNENTDLDEEIAMRLSRSMLMDNADELLAHQISKSDLTLSSHTNHLVPEQLLILERIRLEKEHQINQQIIMQSSLRGLPAFHETALGADGARSHTIHSPSDYQFSQDSELSNWNSNPRGLQTRPTVIRPQANRAPIRSFNAGGGRGNSAREMWAERSQSRSNYNLNINQISNPGTAIAVNTNSRETSFELRNPLATSRVVTNHPYQSIPDNNGFEHTHGITSRHVEATRMIDRNHTSRYGDPQVRNHYTQQFDLPHNVTRRGSQESLASSISAWTNEQFRIDHIDKQPSANHRVMSSGTTNELLRRGSQETRSAIATGQSHVVACQGCGNMLQAPISSSLVFCPTCKTISPGFSVRNNH